MRVVLLGAPGSGKGTQAKMLVRKHGVPQISTGDLLRSAEASGSELGMQVKAAMLAGQLVSDDVVLGIIRQRLRAPDTDRGFVLDGFPRNLAQAAALDGLLAEIDQPLDAAVLLNVDFDILMQRLTGRRTCASCGRVYNIYTTPPKLEGRCDECGGALRSRADDNEETIGNRLRVYETQTRPLIAHYRRQGKMLEVDGVGEIEAIFARLNEALAPFRLPRSARRPAPGKAVAPAAAASKKPRPAPAARAVEVAGSAPAPAARVAAARPVRAQEPAAPAKPKKAQAPAPKAAAARAEPARPARPARRKPRAQAAARRRAGRAGTAGKAAAKRKPRSAAQQKTRPGRKPARKPAPRRGKRAAVKPRARRAGPRKKRR